MKIFNLAYPYFIEGELSFWSLLNKPEKDKHLLINSKFFIPMIQVFTTAPYHKQENILKKTFDCSDAL